MKNIIARGGIEFPDNSDYSIWGNMTADKHWTS